MAVSISLSITQNSQSVANNTSNVTVKVNYSWTSGSWNAYSTTKYVIINGVKYSFNDAKINPNKTTSGSGTLYTKTLNIKHNSDGTKKLEVSAYVNTEISSGVLTKSTTKTLTTIPRASTVTATAAVVGSASTIRISRKSSSFTHTLEYTFGDLSGTITTKTTSTSIKWTLPTTFYAQIGASATSKSGTITCKTYSGSTLLGTKTCSFTAKTSSSTCAPTLSPTVTNYSPTRDYVGDNTTLIRYYSTAKITFGAAAKNSAKISSTKVVNSGKSRTSDGDILTVTSGTFDFTVKDSRGYTTTKTITNKIIPYVKLTCKFNINLNVDGTGTLKIYGDYYNGSFGAVDNTLTVQYRYKKSGSSYSDWITATATKSGNTYTLTKSLSGFDYQSTYVFQARATDVITTFTATAKNAKALPLFDWGSSDFNFNVNSTYKNGCGVQGYKKDGTKNNMIWTTTNDNLMVGGGQDKPNKIYLQAASGGEVYVGNADTDWYNLLGACKALCTTYNLDCAVTDATGYSEGTAYAYLIGNCLRISLHAYRDSAVSVGNINNENVMTIKIKHDGKLDEVYRVGFTSEITGGVASFSAQMETIDTTYVTIAIKLCATTVANSEWNAYFVMPANLKLSAYT